MGAVVPVADSKSFRWAATRESFVQHFVEALLGCGTAHAEAFLLCRKKFSFKTKAISDDSPHLHPRHNLSWFSQLACRTVVEDGIEQVVTRPACPPVGPPCCVLAHLRTGSGNCRRCCFSNKFVALGKRQLETRRGGLFEGSTCEDVIERMSCTGGSNLEVGPQASCSTAGFRNSVVAVRLALCSYQLVRILACPVGSSVEGTSCHEW